MRELLFVIISFFVLTIAGMKPAAAGWITWILSVQEEKKVESAIKTAYGSRRVEVTFVENDWVASIADCVTGKDEERVRIKIRSSGYAEINFPHGTNRPLAEKVLVEVQKVFSLKLETMRGEAR